MTLIQHSSLLDDEVTEAYNQTLSSLYVKVQCYLLFFVSTV